MDKATEGAISSPPDRASRRSVFVLTLAAGITLAAFPVEAEAGFSKVVRKRAFGVDAPFALEQTDGDANDVRLFVGKETRWYEFLALSDIQDIGWTERDVKNIRCYGVHRYLGHSKVYGVTNDGKWFLAGTDGSGLPLYYDEEAVWREVVAYLGGDPDKLLTFEQGYRASRVSLWMWRVCKIAIALALFLLGWLAARSRYRRGTKRGQGSGREIPV